MCNNLLDCYRKRKVQHCIGKILKYCYLNQYLLEEKINEASKRCSSIVVLFTNSSFMDEVMVRCKSI